MTPPIQMKPMTIPWEKGELKMRTIGRFKLDLKHVVDVWTIINGYVVYKVHRPSDKNMWYNPDIRKKKSFIYLKYIHCIYGYRND